MSNKKRRIGFFFSTLIFLALIGGCATPAPRYFPKSLETTPVSNLVKVVIPDNEKIVKIDDQKVNSAPVIYVSPGKHAYTFETDYTSPIYCNGPSYGLKATKDFLYENGQTSSVVFMKGVYSMNVKASEGQTVQFVFKPKPECKSGLEDYFKAVVTK